LGWVGLGWFGLTSFDIIYYYLLFTDTFSNIYRTYFFRRHKKVEPAQAKMFMEAWAVRKY